MLKNAPASRFMTTEGYARGDPGVTCRLLQRGHGPIKVHQPGQSLAMYDWYTLARVTN